MSDYMPKCATCEHFESCIMQKHITEMALILWNISREKEKERTVNKPRRKRGRVMRLIDADALHEALKTKQKWVVRCGDKHNEGYTYDQVHFAIDEAPTIEAVSIDDYHSMENTCYKLQKALYEMADRKEGE